MSCLQSNFLDSEIETESEWKLPEAKERSFCALAPVSISDQFRMSQTVQGTQGSQHEFAGEPLIQPLIQLWLVGGTVDRCWYL